MASDARNRGSDGERCDHGKQSPATPVLGEARHQLRSTCSNRRHALPGPSAPLSPRERPRQRSNAVQRSQWNARPSHVKLESHTPPSALIIKLSPVVYDPLAVCPHWLRFLEEITCGDTEIVKYLQRAVGYSLTGGTSEHALFMVCSSGCNGKTTFIEALRHVFGNYARASDFSTFMQQRSSSAPRNDLAMLCGARLVTATESDDGNHLAESFVKQINGRGYRHRQVLVWRALRVRPAFQAMAFDQPQAEHPGHRRWQLASHSVDPVYRAHRR